MIRNYRTTTHLGLRVEDEGGRGSGEDERKNREEGGGLHFSAIIAENAKLMGGSFRVALDCEKKKEEGETLPKMGSKAILCIRLLAHFLAKAFLLSTPPYTLRHFARTRSYIAHSNVFSNAPRR